VENWKTHTPSRKRLRSNLESAASFLLTLPRADQSHAVANQKGGVGKTTTAVNLAACLAAAGRRILLFDSTRRRMRPAALVWKDRGGGSAYHPLLGDGSLLDKVKPTAFERLEVIPSEVDLCGVDVETGALGKPFAARAHGARAGNQLGAGLIWSSWIAPPSLGVLTLNAFAAADGRWCRCSASIIRLRAFR